jgi:uncharacterized membrane protein HdeD (DUF308 family)
MSATFVKSVQTAVKFWYIPLIVGLIFIGTGIYTFFQPVTTYLVLVWLFSFSFLISGIFEILFALLNRKQIDNWVWILAAGLINAILGAILLSRPEVSIAILPLYVGFGILFRSIAAIGYGFDLKQYGVQGTGNLIFIGILGVVFGTLVIFNPVFGAINIIFWTAISFIISGLYSVDFALKLKKLKSYSDRISPELKEKYEQIKAEVQAQLESK